MKFAGKLPPFSCNLPREHSVLLYPKYRRSAGLIDLKKPVFCTCDRVVLERRSGFLDVSTHTTVMMTGNTKQRHCLVAQQLLNLKATTLMSVADSGVCFKPFTSVLKKEMTFLTLSSSTPFNPSRSPLINLCKQCDRSGEQRQHQICDEQQS